MSAGKILLIEDEEVSRFLCEVTLAQEAFEVTSAKSASMGIAAAEAERFQLFLLDLNLPDEDGLQIIDRLQQLSPKTPVLIVSTRQSPEERSEGFHAGAADYLIKPFHPDELIYRVKNLIQQSEKEAAAEAMEPTTIAIKSWVLHMDSYLLKRRKGVDISLTRGEARLLAHLAQAGGNVVSREALLERIARNAGSGHPRTVDVLISRIRMKIKKVGKAPFEIVNVPEQGYRLEIVG
uniref:Putative transcriptional regulatory protein with a response regulator receiver domain n=1 Tax=Magnetococcus massalia (strain MO-1) TaxID=451514 RepID=A0A1S7LD19_MAGMO|nr:Putative transcriptional regulatory protein with a response regulator receiver domain [Candidatus Magnetococcus massalia]